VIDHLAPDLDQLKTLTGTLNERMPSFLDRTEQLVDHTDGFVSTVGTPEQEEKMKKLINNFAVISDNLKVVSSNAIALTATLAQTPWRLVWGGKTVQPPPAAEVLKSDRALPVKDNVAGH